MKRTLSYLGAGAVALGAMTTGALAQTEPVDLHPRPLAHALLSLFIFAAAGMLATFIAVLLFDKATPRINIQEELLKNNIAVAIVTSAVVIGVSIIVAASMM
jgi:uncharacterized membrane protein YjfL (UPF0719 family)